MSDLEEKLDRVLEAVIEMKPVVRATADTVLRMDGRLAAAEIKNAQQDVQLSNQQSYIENVATRLRAHIDGHWGWVGGVVGVVSGLLALAKFLSHG